MASWWPPGWTLSHGSNIPSWPSMPVICLFALRPITSSYSVMCNKTTIPRLLCQLAPSRLCQSGMPVGDWRAEEREALGATIAPPSPHLICPPPHRPTVVQISVGWTSAPEFYQSCLFPLSPALRGGDGEGSSFLLWGCLSSLTVPSLMSSFFCPLHNQSPV